MRCISRLTRIVLYDSKQTPPTVANLKKADWRSRLSIACHLEEVRERTSQVSHRLLNEMFRGDKQSSFLVFVQ